jgi:hypothetical protein
MWNFWNEGERIRELLPGELTGQEAAKVSSRGCSSVSQHDDRQRSLLPFQMRHRRMGHQRVFEIHGADPFATGFDEVFRAVAGVR